MAVYAGYGANIAGDTTRGPSASLWGNCPCKPWMPIDPGIGWGFFEEWIDKAFTTPTTEANWGARWKAFTSSGGVLGVGDAVGGVLRTTEATDNESVSFAQVQTPFQIDIGQGSLWCEWRHKRSTIATTRNGTIFGLMDTQTLVVGLPITTAGVLDTSINFCGWRCLESAASVADFVYQANAVTPVVTNTAAHTYVADTYVKLGFHYNGSSNVLTGYVNGIPQTTTKTIPTADGTDFPNDVRMGVVFAQMMAAANSDSTDHDWIAIAQQAP